jgi:long-chain acyl-CoA synthetase
VVPTEAALSKFAVDKGLAESQDSLETLVDNVKVVDAVHAELLNVGKRGGLAGMELIQGLVLVSEEWTPENVYPPIPLIDSVNDDCGA